MAKYIGITLGPIGDTMELTSTPAGLWAASYLFSYLAHEIRIGIGKEGLIQDNLKYDDQKEGIVSSLWEKGIGLYHDRIIYEADDDNTIENAFEAVDNAIEKIVKGFSETKAFENEDNIRSFFRSYLNIHIIAVDVEGNDNFLIKVNDALDAAELEKNFPSTIGSNPILHLFDGGDNGKNEVIKNSFLVSRNDELKKLNWVLANKSEKGIKDLGTIAACKDAKTSPYANRDKAVKYYAVIRADGDNMGKTIKETIKTEKDYIGFSEKCLRYGCRTAEIVLRYGGIPIYVGGDDLLCIVPLICNYDEENHTFLEMLKEIRSVFKSEFPGDPDLSFGIQIQYVKAPLYEALNESAGLLFGVAKSNKPGALAINLKKHSGQSSELLIKNIGTDTGSRTVEALDKLIKKHASEDTLKSVGKHVEEFAVLLNKAGKDGNYEIDYFFENTFDNGLKDEQIEYIKEISGLAKMINYTKNGNSLAEELASYIRLIKFFSEKADKEE